ncbi:hypothetical protein [Ornithinimicrobium kibberense]|uniref:hypothetical protein n=1 Tax=Ornithinimicrobium kibberense TaxID=282060 RepID=UPI00360645C4
MADAYVIGQQVVLVSVAGAARRVKHGVIRPTAPEETACPRNCCGKASTGSSC